MMSSHFMYQCGYMGEEFTIRLTQINESAVTPHVQLAASGHNC